MIFSIFSPLSPSKVKMASKQAHKRLTKEYLGVQKNPIPFIVTKPKEDNILEWYVMFKNGFEGNNGRQLLEGL